MNQTSPAAFRQQPKPDTREPPVGAVVMDIGLCALAYGLAPA